MSSRTRAVVAVALMTIGLVVVHLSLRDYAFDDAYIHVRIAERLLASGAPYYNAGDAVMGSSSPVWTLVLSALFPLIGSGPAGLAVLNALFSGAGAIVFCMLLCRFVGRETPTWLRWAFGLVYLSLVQFSSIGLMETPLALLLLGCGVLLYSHGRASAFLLFGIAAFVRPELAVFPIVFLAHGTIRRRVAPVASLAFGLAGTLPFLAYVLAFFPATLPNTIVAKSIVYSLSRAQVVAYLLTHGLPRLSDSLPAIAIGAAFGALALAFGFALWAEARSGRTGDPASEALYLTAGCGAIIALTYVLAGGLLFPWYVPLPAVPLTLALYALGLRRQSHPVALLAVALLVLPHGLALARTTTAALGNRSGYVFFAENGRVLKYLDIGRQLHERFPDATLMSSEIGGLGRHFEGRLVDGVGLISPEALEFHPMSVPDERRATFLGAIPAGFVAKVRPGLIVSMDIFVESFVRSDAARDYVRLREPIYVERDLALAPAASLWGSTHINIFVRRDLLPAGNPRLQQLQDQP